MDLLLEADPSKEAIHKYLEKSDMYGLKMGDEIISVAVICPVSANEVELKNLATKEKYRNKLACNCVLLIDEVFIIKCKVF